MKQSILILAIILIYSTGFSEPCRVSKNSISLHKCIEGDCMNGPSKILKNNLVFETTLKNCEVSGPITISILGNDIVKVELLEDEKAIVKFEILDIKKFQKAVESGLIKLDF